MQQLNNTKNLPAHTAWLSRPQLCFMQASTPRKGSIGLHYDLLFLITYLFCFNGSLAGPVWLARLYLNHNAVLIVIAEHSLPFLAQSQSNQSVAE